MRACLLAFTGLTVAATAAWGQEVRLPARPQRALFILAAGAGAPMASGTGTTAEAMLRLAGAGSAIESYAGYRAVSAEAALAAAPDCLVAPSHTVDAAGGPAAFLSQPQFALLPVARARRLVSLDSLYLLGFGPCARRRADTVGQAWQLAPARHTAA